MRKRVCVAGAILLLGLMGWLTWKTMRRAEPACQGKPLSYWLALNEKFCTWDRCLGMAEFLDPAESPKGKEARQVSEALRAFGSDILPPLLHRLRRKDNRLAEALDWLTEWQSFIHVPSFADAEHQHLLAMLAFESLGAAGSNAVPDLLAIYRENVSEHSRCAVVLSLGKIGPAAQAAVPCLVEAVSSTNFILRFYALDSLGRIGSRPDLALPVIIQGLDDPNPSLRMGAACALAMLEGGPEASTTATLERLLHDPDERLRQAAAKALAVSDLQAAAKAAINTNAPSP